MERRTFEDFIRGKLLRRVQHAKDPHNNIADHKAMADEILLTEESVTLGILEGFDVPHFALSDLSRRVVLDTRVR